MNYCVYVLKNFTYRECSRSGLVCSRRRSNSPHSADLSVALLVTFFTFEDFAINVFELLGTTTIGSKDPRAMRNVFGLYDKGLGKGGVTLANFYI